MFSISDIKLLASGVQRALNWRAARNNPIRLQADRLIRAFEAHGLLRQQLPRILPSGMSMPMLAFSNADALMDHLSPALLDWSASTLAVKREWFDGKDVSPHDVVRMYKHGSEAYQWLKDRETGGINSGKVLHVIGEAISSRLAESSGRFVVIYEESFAILDDTSLGRYLVWSEGYQFEHAPCVTDLLCMMACADSASVAIRGAKVNRKQLDNFESGTLLAPEFINTAKTARLINGWVPAAGAAEGLDEWHRQNWLAARALLIGAGLAESVLWFDKSLGGGVIPTGAPPIS